MLAITKTMFLFANVIHQPQYENFIHRYQKNYFANFSTLQLSPNAGLAAK